MHPVTLLPFEEIYLTNLLVLSGGKGILRRASEDNFTVCGFSISDYELSLIGEEIERATNRQHFWEQIRKNILMDKLYL